MNTMVHRQWTMIRQQKVLLTAIVINGIVLTFHWVVMILKAQPSEFPVFLHYTTILGVSEPGPWYGLFIFPITGTVILGINLMISLLREDLFAPYTLFIISGISQLALLTGSILLLLKNS